MDGWKTNFLLGWLPGRWELLVSGSVAVFCHLPLGGTCSWSFASIFVSPLIIGGMWHVSFLKMEPIHDLAVKGESLISTLGYGGNVTFFIYGFKWLSDLQLWGIN